MFERTACLFFAGALTALAASQGCVGSLQVAAFRLTVAPPLGNTAGYLPMRHVNNIPAGYRVRYQPAQLPSDITRDSRLTLVLVPRAAEGQTTVLEPRPAMAATEWQVPFPVRTAVLVFAPKGMDEKRLTNLVTRDENLVNALADYADQTADLEAGLDALNFLDDELAEDADKPMPASTPAEQALFALVRALNPAVSSYNPLGTGRKVAAQTLMGKGSDMFFENAGGIVPGGGILPDVKSWLLPDTEFRSVYGLAGEGDAMTLCAQLQQRTRNKVAYLWAYRLNNSAAPAASVTKVLDFPIGLRVSIPLKLDKSADWRILPHSYDWTLTPESGAATLPVKARVMDDDRLLQLDLRQFAGAPGNYKIEGKWDWSPFTVGGTVRLRKLDDLKIARLTPESQDRFVTATGPVVLEMADASGLFIDKVWLHRPSSSRQIPASLVADTGSPLKVEVDTDGLREGQYLLALSRIDGVVAEMPLRLLPPMPKITVAGPRVNIGEREQVVKLVGSGLDRIDAIESEAADFTLRPASADGTQREVEVRLRPNAAAGGRLTLSAKVAGMSQTLRFTDLLQIAASRPKILEAKSSVPRDGLVTLKPDELPSGSWVSFAMRVEPAGVQPAVTLQCAEAGRMVQTQTARAGEKTAAVQFTGAGDGAWFLSLDPGSVGQSGCTLQATIETEALGKSDPFALGKLVRLPRVENFALSDEKVGEGFAGTLRGFDLETIDKTGWNAQGGVAVPELPRPVAGEGAKQSLRIAMPWPSPTPKSPLYIWLRGETEGRATRVTQ